VACVTSLEISDENGQQCKRRKDTNTVRVTAVETVGYLVIAFVPMAAGNKGVKLRQELCVRCIHCVPTDLRWKKNHMLQHIRVRFI
jgi:hypothetical protein